MKRRSATLELAHFQSLDKVQSINGKIECEHPNENLISFEGRATVKADSLSEEIVVPLTMNNLFLRGSVLRNTDFAYAIVIYTGNNTKIIKNLKQSGVKASTLEHKLNWLVAYAFVYNAFLLITSVILEYQHYTWALNKETTLQASNPSDYATEWYIGPRNTGTSLHVLISIISFFSMYTYVIPISLFVTLEITRLIQSVYMALDPLMTYKQVQRDGSIKMVPMRTNNSNLNEDLGCIDYIFSDKTGTLTQNLMRPAMWFVLGQSFDEMETPGVLEQIVGDPKSPAALVNAVEAFMLALGLCHEVIPSVDDITGQINYESQSPDETALLNGMRSNGVKLQGRTKQHMQVEVFGQMKRYEILNVLEFNSTRKRMSVIMRVDGKIMLFCKGADSIIIPRLSNNPKISDPNLLEQAEEALLDYSRVGLRTLVIGRRILSEQAYQTFKDEYEVAERSLVDREDMLESACNSIECELTLLGCTAIEDRLQDNVPETIDYLLKAGIKLWLLTGDKQETAINIGMSSKLVNSDMELLILSAPNPDAAELEMDENIEKIRLNPEKTYALIVSGEVLGYAFSSENHKQKFLSIGTKCHSVICARVTPLQKALVVRLVRSSLKQAVTLAIGDGANDVSMIQEAHVGVGIMGREGTQAVRAADFAFGEFQFLERLVSVHGRYNFLRMTGLIYFSFYKNITFITVQWLFGFYNAWSAQLVFEEVFYLAFNVIFTSLPPLAYSIYEKDVGEDKIKQYPQLYHEVQKGLYWNYGHMIRWFLTAIIHSLLIFGTVYFINFEGAVDISGRSTGYWVQCYLLSTPLLITVLVKSVVLTRFWVWPVWSSLLISIVLNVGVMFFLMVIESIIYTDTETAVIVHALPAYYLLCFVMPALCNVPDIVVTYYKSMLAPSDADIMMEESKIVDRSKKSLLAFKTSSEDQIA